MCLCIWDISAVVLLDVSFLPLTFYDWFTDFTFKCTCRPCMYIFAYIFLLSFSISEYSNTFSIYSSLNNLFSIWSIVLMKLFIAFHLIYWIFHFEYFNFIFQSFSLLNSFSISHMDSIISFCYLFLFSWDLFKSLFMSSLISSHILITKLLNSLSGISFNSLYWKLLLWN